MQAVTVDVVTNEADAFTTKITLNRPRADVVFVQDLDDEGKVLGPTHPKRGAPINYGYILL